LDNPLLIKYFRVERGKTKKIYDRTG
jgi:hypothetical protein